MTSARVQPFCQKYFINIGCYDGFKVWPRDITERKIAFYVHKNNFCLIRISQNICFNKPIEGDLKPNFKVVDNVISVKLVKSFFKYKRKPRKNPIWIN